MVRGGMRLGCLAVRSAGTRRPPPFDIETFAPIEPAWQAIREWIPDDDGDPVFDLFDQRTDARQPVEIPCEDRCILILNLD